jgi:hypothetical protein
MNIFSFGISAGRFTGISLAALFAVSVAAQPNADASLLFSRNMIGGTARTAGTGGAFSSVGADLGAMELNPAGLGIYRSSEICVTPGLRIAADQSSYDGTKSSASHPSLEFAQAGLAFTKKFASPAANGLSPLGLRSLTFAINFQTDNSFERNQSFGLTNTSHSLIDNYVGYANQGTLFPEVNFFTAAGIIGTASPGAYYSNVRAPVLQAGSLDTRGGIDRISLGMGGNVGDKLFFGFSLGIPILNYSTTMQMYEGNANPQDSVTHFQNYQLTSTVNESGVGVTGKVGLIYKPAPWVRFGASYSLPTWYFMSENYSSDLLFNFDTTTTTEITGSANPLHYRIRTPMKGTVGASFYLKEHGFISVDYDFQNLGGTRYSFTDPGYSSGNALYNNYLKATYGYSHTVRIGLEAAIKKLRLRAGYSYTSSPFKKSKNYATPSGYNADVHNATVGIGGRFNRFYIDLAYVFSYTKDGVSPGFQTPLDEIDSRYMTHSILLTLGFRISRDKETAPAKERTRRSSDQLPKYLDPGDKY